MKDNSFVKIATLVPYLEIGKPLKNVKYILEEIDKIISKKPHFIVLPELAITGYSCSDMFFQSYLIEENTEAIKYFLKNNKFKGVVIFGALYLYKNNLFNCAYVVKEDKVLGIIPKTFLPNRDEFYEARYFTSSVVLNDEIIYVEDFNTTFGTQLFFEESKKLTFGVEVCEDMWSPIPPASYQAISGAEIIFNVSTSNETLNKDEVRRYIIQGFTKRNNCAYVYCSSGLYESSQDTTYSNHCLIVENGTIKAEANLFNKNSTIVFGEVDIGSIRYQKRKNATIRESLRMYIDNYSTVNFNCNFNDEKYEFVKPLSKTPFVPENNLEESFRKILEIQVAALARRIKHINAENVVLGLSGGLDSTLALLVLDKTFTFLNKDKKGIKLITMPGLGTSSRTLNNAHNLAKALNLAIEEINISDLTLKHLSLLKHDPNNKDITFENTQARLRTSILFNKANQLNGFVLGTSDMSELALGWCTFNGDQMANYSINIGLPKTVIKFMVKAFSEYEYYHNKLLVETLEDILNTPISPELSSKEQKTENIIGKYEINDFILYRFLVCGDNKERIKYLLSYVFSELSVEERENYLETFFRRFYSQQFKRSSMPDGPKVLDISLSPRTDLRMPSDISY